MDTQGAIIDDGIGPGVSDQLFLGDRLAGVLDQCDQNVERTTPRRSGFPSSSSVRCAGISRNDPKAKVSSSIGKIALGSVY